MPTEIPDWILRKKLYPGGVRLPKLTRWFSDAKTDLSAYNSRFLPTVYAGYTNDPITEPLTNGDFRFWNGSQATTLRHYASCRMCGALEFNRRNRKEHMKEGCGGKLTAAYRLLAKDFRCVICNDKTSRSHWGVMLCSKDCEVEWSYVTRQPDALTAALELVIR